MSRDLDTRLARHQEDYEKVTGNPFAHFFCPVLWRDEPAELCLGHVVNRAFSNSAGVRVVQRKDVDGFYGSVFESKFVACISARDKTPEEVAIDPNLSRTFRPGATVDGEECEIYPADVHRSGGLPANHSIFCLQTDYGLPLRLIVKKPADEIGDEDGCYFEISLDVDARIAALVSLVKSAHLTLFTILGYQYALSAAGDFVGRQLLGSFYREHVGKRKNEVCTAADSYFHEFLGMINEIGVAEGVTIRGTVEDGQVAICYGSSGCHFAIGVFVRIGVRLFCIIMPAFDHPDAVPTYLNFLANSNDRLAIKLGRYNHQERRWETDESAPRRIPWPKSQE